MNKICRHTDIPIQKPISSKHSVWVGFQLLPLIETSTLNLQKNLSNTQIHILSKIHSYTPLQSSNTQTYALLDFRQSHLLPMMISKFKSPNIFSRWYPLLTFPIPNWANSPQPLWSPHIPTLSHRDLLYPVGMEIKIIRGKGCVFISPHKSTAESTSTHACMHR